MPVSPTTAAAVVKTVLSFLLLPLYWKEWMWEDNGHLQPPATTQLVRLQSLVRFWREPPATGVQGAEERIRSRFKQTSDFQCVR